MKFTKLILVNKPLKVNNNSSGVIQNFRLTSILELLILIPFFYLPKIINMLNHTKITFIYMYIYVKKKQKKTLP